MTDRSELLSRWKLDNVPSALADRRQWLIWRFEQKDSDPKPRKMPYYASGAKRYGDQGSERDRARMVTLPEAAKAAGKLGFDGVGIAFLPGDGLVGVDLDNAIDPDTGQVAEVATAIIGACATFTEVTPSGKGVHLYVMYSPPEGDDGKSVSGRANDIGGGVGLEMYSGRQFFTVTGLQWDGSPSVVRQADDALIRRIKATIEQAKAAKRGRRSAVPAQQYAAPDDLRVEQFLIESALGFIQADQAYNDWIGVGMAIHDRLGAGAFSVWDAWSARGEKYPGDAEMTSHWRSFDGRAPGGAGVIFTLAKAAGWRRPPIPLHLRPQNPAAEAPPPAGEAPAGEEAPAPPEREEPPITDEQIEKDAARMKWVSGFRLTEKGAIVPSLFNTLVVLEHDDEFREALGFNEFAYRIVMREGFRGRTKDKEWTDADDVLAMVRLSKAYGFEPKKTTVMDAVLAHALTNKFNPLRDYLTGLEWDGVKRIPNAFFTYWGAASPQETASLTRAEVARLRLYLMLASCYWFTGAVRRALSPGCKLDTMVVFEGGQGAQKSSSIRALFGDDFFADSKLNLENKDSLAQMQGKWAYEMAEMDAFSKAEDNLFKLFMSTQVDRVRWHYGKRAEDVPRASLFIGTTNQSVYGKDPTGMRRTWPVQVGKIDREAILRDRDQLWAEAVHYMNDKKRHWVERDAIAIDPDNVPKDLERYGPGQWTEWNLFKEQADRRQIQDAWITPMLDYLDAHDTQDHFTTAELLEHAIGLSDRARWTRAEQMRVGAIMGQMGFLNRKKGPSNRRYNAWVPPEYVAKDEPENGGDDDIPF